MTTTRWMSLGLSLCLPLSLSFASLAAAGCSAEPLASDTQAISGGSVVTSNALPFGAVVNFRVNSGFACTGAKIGPRRFITASHCMLDRAAGDTVLLSNALDGSMNPSTDQFTLATVAVHPTVLNWDLYDYERAFDVATFTLTTDTPNIPSIGVRGAYVAPGTSAMIVGYGCDQIGHINNRKQVASFASDTLAEIRDAYGDERGLAVFTYNLVYFQSNPRLCEGDSGGPLLMQDGLGRWVVAGISSTGNDSIISTQARVNAVSKWVLDPTVDQFVAGSRGFWLNGKSNLCMGISGASGASNASAGQYYCDMRFDGLDNQYWMLIANGTSGTFRIRNGKSGLCLGVDGASIANGARIAQYTCALLDGHLDNQAWRFPVVPGGHHQIQNAASGRCIGVDGASMDREAGMYQFNCSNDANQGWIFVK